MAWTLRFSKLLQVIPTGCNSVEAWSFHPSLTSCIIQAQDTRLSLKVSVEQSSLLWLHIKSFSEVSEILAKLLFNFIMTITSQVICVCSPG